MTLQQMKKIVAIVSKPTHPVLPQVVPELVTWLRRRGYGVVGDRETAKHMRGLAKSDREKIARAKPEFVIVLGGDGTLLAASRAVSERGIPILGVNLGSLGFLTEVPLAELYTTLETVVAGKCKVDERSMIECEVIRRKRRAGIYHALNDAVLNKTHLARIVDYDVYVDGTLVANYKADGIIVATPTGSTAYSLAAGGPILLPTAQAFVITPVSPHALTNRPLVVRDHSEISAVVRSADQEAYLSIDGQVGEPLMDGDRVICRRSKYHVRLLRTGNRTFFDVLRTRLKWGQRADRSED
jgi:NAD+ kinase